MLSTRLFSRAYSFFLLSNLRFSSASSARSVSSMLWVWNICSFVNSCWSCNCCRSTLRCSSSSAFTLRSASSCCNWLWRWVFSSWICTMVRCKFWMLVSATATFFSASNWLRWMAWFSLRNASMLLRFSSNTRRLSSTACFSSSSLPSSSSSFISSSFICSLVNSILSSSPFSWPPAFCKNSFRLASFSLKYCSRWAARLLSLSLLRTAPSISLKACCISCRFFSWVIKPSFSCSSAASSSAMDASSSMRLSTSACCCWFRSR